MDFMCFSPHHLATKEPGQAGSLLKQHRVQRLTISGSEAAEGLPTGRLRLRIRPFSGTGQRGSGPR
ncbi:hypothetical protein AWJ14_12080 [Hoeflea olei]|uniref:Uncharacterized protein n=1 Tax=Hoeflea olei TaxID=1480615 RepID=A0A1C1YRF1_9HYPH|nr:hypothetical protein AWJ14_12080 [Hoeflea olei]